MPVKRRPRRKLIGRPMNQRDRLRDRPRAVSGESEQQIDPGLADRLTDSERRIYDFMVKVGQLHDHWDGWHAAVAFITGWLVNRRSRSAAASGRCGCRRSACSLPLPRCSWWLLRGQRGLCTIRIRKPVRRQARTHRLRRLYILMRVPAVSAPRVLSLFHRR